MLTLEFEGFFQMRMATDPDPTDEKRGVSGYTFALPGEIDFDAKVHLQPGEPGVQEREFGRQINPNRKVPKVGVFVTRATRDGERDPELEGAAVAFVGAQVLEHNGLLVRNDFFVINPLRVQIRKGDEVLLDRVDWLNPAEPDMNEMSATGPQLLRRQPKLFTSNSPIVAEALGLPDASNLSLKRDRLERREALLELLAKTRDPVARAGLETRIEQLAIVEQWWNLSQGSWENRPIDRRAYMVGMQLDGWDIDVNGNVTANTVGADPSVPWRLRFWMGGWDGDALCGYVRGTWDVAAI